MGILGMSFIIGESAMRYTVYEESSGNLSQVLKTDCFEAAKVAYSKCYGNQRGAGGVFDNVTRKWVL